MFDAAGGYAPTLGILGAVLGLIHVMENLSEPSKLRMKIRHDSLRKEMIVAAVCCIQEGANPTLVEKQLQTFLDQGSE
jgi:chemotaxis protein MotA